MNVWDAIYGLAGGAMIGLSASLLMLFNGRVAGIAGIVGGLLGASVSELSWRLAFLLGLITGPLLFSWVSDSAIAIETSTSTPLLVVAGLLVGFGTRLGNGCTSGHGVCGLSRGSKRSLVATVTFFAIAAITVYLSRHVLEG